MEGSVKLKDFSLPQASDIVLHILEAAKSVKNAWGTHKRWNSFPGLAVKIVKHTEAVILICYLQLYFARGLPARPLTAEHDLVLDGSSMP